jgi:hypothetical protein
MAHDTERKVVSQRAARSLSRSLIGSLSGVSTALTLALGSSGCVAAKHYEEARSIASAEMAAHQRANVRLAAAQGRITALEAELAEKERSLATGEEALAQGQLAANTLKKEREEATELMAQLRSDLSRTGSHLKVFSTEKQTLEQKLRDAEQRFRNVEAAEKNLSALVSLTRDLTLSLAEPVGNGSLELRARDGEVVISASEAELFSGDALRAEARPQLGGLSRVAALHPKLRVIVRAAPQSPGPQRRLEALAEALRAGGTKSVEVVLPEATKPADPSAESTGTAGRESDADATDWAPPHADAAASDAPVASAEYEIAFSAAQR